MKSNNRSLLCLLLCGLLLTGCGGSAVPQDTETQGSSTDTTTSTEPSNRLDKLGERDFKGDTFTLYTNALPSNHVNIPEEEENGDLINDGLYRRNKEIGERYNIVIGHETFNDNATAKNTVQQAVLAGDDSYDMIIGIIPELVGLLATEGILADLCSIDHLTLDAEWWSPLVYESCRIGDKMYYTTGDISPAVYCAPACYYANCTLLDEYKIPVDDLYTHVENGTWTLDVLNQLAGELDRDLNEDSAMIVDDDFFGILNENNKLTACCFLTSSGIDLNTVKDDTLQSDLASEKVVNVIEKLSGILCTASRKDGNALHTAFMGDRAVFMMHYVSSAYTRYRDMESDYVILPMPKLDEEQETYRSLVNTWTNSFVAVPTNADTDKVGFIMEALAYWSHENLRPTVYENAFKNKGARNIKDAEMLDTIFDTLYLDFNSFLDFGRSTTIISNAIFKGADFMSSYQAISAEVNQAMQDFADAWLQK